jgi:predicted metal-dependent hydrolase
VLPVRAPVFEYPDDLAVAWNPSFPELACSANAISVLMPYVEPYFVKSIRATLSDLDEPLRARTSSYLKQELQHHVQHRRFNDLLAAQCPSLRRLERVVRRTYGWLERRGSTRFNVAFAAGSETIAFGIARWIDRHVDALFDAADPVVASLYLWHLAEEVEHKTAAYDVFEATDGSRLRYAWASAVSLFLVFVFTLSGSLLMLRSERRLRYPVAWFRLTRWSISLAFTVLPVLASSALPGHNPSSFADPPFLSQWLRGFDAPGAPAAQGAPGAQGAPTAPPG